MKQLRTDTATTATTNTPTTWATVQFRFHIAPNLLLFLAIIKLTLCSGTLLCHRGGGGRGKEQSRYASKDVATRRNDGSDSAANKGAACPVEMPMTWPFSMALGASASARVRVCVSLMSCVWPTRQGSQEGRPAGHVCVCLCVLWQGCIASKIYFLSKLELEDHTRWAAAPCGAAFNNSMANTFLSACPNMTLTKCSSWERVQEQCQVEPETETEAGHSWGWDRGWRCRRCCCCCCCCLSLCLCLSLLLLVGCARIVM